MSTTHAEEHSLTREEHFVDSSAAEATFFERRAKVGVLLSIVSDGMMVLAAFFSFVYLHVLNTSHAFKPAGEHAPAMAGGWWSPC